MSRYFEQGPLMDRDTLKAVLPVFIDEVEELHARLLSAELRSDPEVAKKAVHQLRGVAGSFGATLIYEQSTELEQRIEQSVSGNALPVDELNQKLDRLCETVSATLTIIKAEYL